MQKIQKYPRTNELVKVLVHWGRSNLNGEHLGRPIKKPFRARSGAILRPFDCQTCGKVHCIPWTSNQEVIEFYKLE